jgi:hypothetical protein
LIGKSALADRNVSGRRDNFMRYLLSICLIFISCAMARVAAADEIIEVDVQLFLAVDVSRSMTPRELEIQRRGYAEALVSDAVVKAIGGGLLGKIALTYVEWAGTDSQRIVVDWTTVGNRREVEAFASRLTAQFDNALRRTSISGALDYAAASIESNGFVSYRKVIDVSGDGPNNQGRPVLPARDAALAKGVTINGLPLMTREGMGSQFHLEDLDEYYRHCVIGGPRSFVIPVTEWDAFPEAVRRKLVLELAQNPVIVHRASFHGQSTSTYDCMIGEKIWQRFQGDFFNP